MTPCFVLDGKILGCVEPAGQFKILAIYGSIPWVARYTIALDKRSSLKPATQYDFDHFRVDSEGYFVF